MTSLSAKGKAGKLSRHLIVIFLISGLLGGCAWYRALSDQETVREAHISDHSLMDQDPDLRKFYELQQRIELLEKKLNRSDAHQQDKPAVRSNFYDVNKKAEQAISYIRRKTEQSIGVLNDIIANMKLSTSVPTNQISLAQSDSVAAAVKSPLDASGAAPVVKSIKNGAVSGEIVRDDSGKVVKATTDGKKYNYSVVYVYPETKPWFDMWALLESEGVSDKWRGKNIEKQTYFIYVGAYYTPRPAERRQNKLMALTGVRPDVRVREGYQTVAMK